MNVSDQLRQAAERDPHGVALVDRSGSERREQTWAELDAAASALGGALGSHGLRAGQRVAVLLPNGIEMVVAHHGVLRAGLVSVPLNPRMDPDQLAGVLADAEPRAVIGTAAAHRALSQVPLPADLVRITVDEPAAGQLAWADLLAGAGTEPVAPVDPETLALLMYIAGPSGTPAGAMLTHRSLLANIEQLAAERLVTAEDVVLGVLPLTHVYALGCVLGQVVRHGATLVLVDRFDPVTLPALIAQESVTNLPLAPPAIAAWAEGDLREALAGVRLVVCGGAALDPELAAAFTAATGHVVEQGYGLTEASPVVSTTIGGPRSSDGAVKPWSVGRPLPGIEVQIAERVDGRLRESLADDPEQIWIRGANLFSGFWPDGSHAPDEDGWYPTGDVGIIDDDGDLVLVDRVREVITVSGFSVYPREIEDVIDMVPGVQQSAVIGVPDGETGQQVTAFIALEADVSAEDVRLAVIDRCQEQLARFKQPARLIVVDDVPTSSAGKIAKHRLRALVWGQGRGL